MSEARLWAVVPAAGVGARMGSDIPKQYLTLAGATVVEHSLRALLAHADIAGIMVALQAQDRRAEQLTVFKEPRVFTTLGGDQRCDSVLMALAALAQYADDSDWVLVHDAARPCVEVADIEALIAAVRKNGDGAILAEPVVDTLKRGSGRQYVAETVDRTGLWRAQTPQMFRLSALQSALEKAALAGHEVTDEASAMELAGYPVQLVSGSSRNLQITQQADLSLAEFYLKGGAL